MAGESSSAILYDPWGHRSISFFAAHFLQGQHGCSIWLHPAQLLPAQQMPRAGNVSPQLLPWGYSLLIEGIHQYVSSTNAQKAVMEGWHPSATRKGPWGRWDQFDAQYYRKFGKLQQFFTVKLKLYSWIKSYLFQGDVYWCFFFYSVGLLMKLKDAPRWPNPCQEKGTALSYLPRYLNTKGVCGLLYLQGKLPLALINLQLVPWVACTREHF